jgi:hypothetical protein
MSRGSIHAFVGVTAVVASGLSSGGLPRATATVAQAADGPVHMDIYTLDPTRDGGYLYIDERFTAVVAPDGAVTFDDVRISSPAVRLGVVDWLINKRNDRRRAPPPPMAMAPFRPDPKEADPIHRAGTHYSAMNPYAGGNSAHLPMLVGVRGGFDITDEFMRIFTKNDPYRFEKARFMSTTSEFRLKLAVAAQTRNLVKALADLPARLRRLLRDERFSPRERRRVLFLLWDEVDRDDPEHRKAADILTTFVRRELPANSPDAFTADELRALNAGRPHPFAPYAPPPSAPAVDDNPDSEP